jgi:hypothetical protein
MSVLRKLMGKMRTGPLRSQEYIAQNMEKYVNKPVGRTELKNRES